MSQIRIYRTGDQLCLEWPLLPRLVRHLGWVTFVLLWPVAGFEIASMLGGLGASAAMALAMAPAIAAMVAGAPRLAGEFGSSRLVMVRTGTKIAVGRAPAVEGRSFSVRMLERRRLFARAYFVCLSCTRRIGQADVEQRLLNARFSAPGPALGLASELREFIESN